MLDIKNIEFILDNIVLGKGIKGAVGTSASYRRLLGKNTQNLENDVMKNLDVKAFLVSSQTYPSKVDFLVISALSSLHSFTVCPNVLKLLTISEERVRITVTPFVGSSTLSRAVCASSNAPEPKFVSVVV